MLQKLLEDHLHIQQTLGVLEKHFLKIANGGNPDFDLMMRVVVYLQEYTEQVHHPMEDAIFSVLLKRNSGIRKQLNELMTDHTRMEKSTRRLRTLLENMKNDPQENKAELERTLPLLLKRLRHHIEAEEENIFPLIKSTITTQDWENIRLMIPDSDDPIFGRTVKNDYKLLYQALDMMS